MQVSKQGVLGHAPITRPWGQGAGDQPEIALISVSLQLRPRHEGRAALEGTRHGLVRAALLVSADGATCQLQFATVYCVAASHRHPFLQQLFGKVQPVVLMALTGERHPASGAVCQPWPTSLANHVTYSASINGRRPRNSEANWTLEVFSQVFGRNDFSARLTAPRTLIVQCHGYFSDSTVGFACGSSCHITDLKVVESCFG